MLCGFEVIKVIMFNFRQKVEEEEEEEEEEKEEEMIRFNMLLENL